MPNVSVKVASNGAEALPDDQVGELLIRSNCMLASDHNNWEETQRAMADGWVRTGDLAEKTAGPR